MVARIYLTRDNVGMEYEEGVCHGEYIALNFHPDSVEEIHKALGRMVAPFEGRREGGLKGQGRDYYEVLINGELITVDWKIANLVDALNNQFGIETYGSDQGVIIPEGSKYAENGRPVEKQHIGPNYGFVSLDKDKGEVLIGLLLEGGLKVSFQDKHHIRDA